MTRVTFKRAAAISGFVVFLFLTWVLFAVPSHMASLQEANPASTSLAFLPHLRSGPTPLAPAVIRISYIYYPPLLRKANEYVRIENQGGSSQSMLGWKLKNEDGYQETYTFPDFTLDPGKKVDVYSACGLETEDKLYWCHGDHYFPIWGHGETACVYKPDMTQVHCMVVP